MFKIFYELSMYPVRRHTDIIVELNKYAKVLKQLGNTFDFEVKPSKRYIICGKIIINSNLAKNIILEGIDTALKNTVATRIWW